MRRITIFTTSWCGFCTAAKAFLESRELEYEEIVFDGEPAFRARLHELTGAWTVPQILVDDTPIGGYAELRRLDADGRLDELLAA